MEIDLKNVAQEVIRNNMGVGHIELRVRGKVEEGTAKFAETGQKLPVQGAPSSSSKPWLVFDVERWKEEGQVTLVWKREQDGPRAR